MAVSIDDMVRQMSRTRSATPAPEAATAQAEPTPQATATASSNLPTDVLSVSLDLGGDTLKIAFSCAKDGATFYGKLTMPDALTQIAIPAMAYYDADAGKWLYGDEIDQSGCEDFITIVKIKSLISLLAMPERPKVLPNSDGTPVSDKKKREAQAEWERRKAIWESNIDHYKKKSFFPKFYFPVKHAALDDFAKMVEADMTFEAKGYTPHTVCEGFFGYVQKLVNARRLALEKKLKRKFGNVRVCLVHPAKVGEEYLKEYSRLVEKKFKISPFKTISTNRALALYALHRGAVKEGESFLVFDMGEESISVVGASILDGQVAIDGVDGHSQPKDIGGNDVDKAIVEYLEAAIDGRETIGTPAFGEEGHIREESVYSKQYLLMRSVKRAKVIFSKPLAADSVFRSGVPITFSREVFVQRRLSKKEIAKSIGIDDKSGIAAEVVKYILEEAKFPINRKVTKIFVSGGLVETYGLLDYIKAELKNAKCNLTVCTFDDGKENGDDFVIRSFEDSVFAASVGGSIVGLHNIEIKTILSLSYGTWSTTQKDNKKRLSLFASRGAVIGPEGTEFFTDPLRLLKMGVPKGEEFYSVVLTKAEIDSQYKGVVHVGNPNTEERRKAMRDVGLVCVAGGALAKTYMKHKGRFVYLATDEDSNAKLLIRQGFFVDKYGHAQLIVRNAVEPGSKEDRMVDAYYYNSLSDQEPKGARVRIRLSEIEPVMSGIDDIYTN